MAKKILTEEDKRAIWFIVENKFFKTKDLEGSRKWLIAYGKFIKQILEIKEDIEKPKNIKDEITHYSPINFSFGKFTYSINFPKQIEKFSYTISIKNEQFNYHFDKKYSLQEKVLKYDKVGLQNKLQKSIKSGEFEKVIRELLEKMIVHPALHNHPSKDEFHGIRLSFAIENPYLFLYHFAFQLIERGADYHDKNKQAKNQELSRLTNVIVNNFDLKHENKIDVKKLFEDIK